MSNDMPALYLRELRGSSFEDGRLKMPSSAKYELLITISP
jgi:hypothetical protein